MGKILRVDLSTGEMHDEALPEEPVLRRYVGGKGLALWYLARETTPAMQAVDPEAPLIFMNGPLSGTAAPSSSDYCVASLHMSIPYAAGAGHSHGFWGAYLKFAGYDGIIFTGVSPRPVYLLIDDGKPELRDASKLWGKGTRDTEHLVKEEIGSPARISVACIGPGGEAVLHGGAIKNDENHGAHKGSPGAVMGSKKLKAIAVTGNAQVPIADPDAFAGVVGVWDQNVRAGRRIVGMGNGGILRGYSAGAGMRFMNRNLTDPTRGQVLHDAFARDTPQWVVEGQPSFNCAIACAYNAKITTGPCAGLTAHLDGGGENIEPAALIGVDDAGTALMLADYFDDQGLDASLSMAVIGAAFEMYDRGLITKEDVDGLDLRWGNFEAAMELLEKMMRREGVGAELATGMKQAVRALHPDGGRFLAHVKGSGFNFHDWRGNWPVLLGQVLAGTGPSWHGAGIGEPELIPPSEPFDPEGKAAAVVATQPKKIWEDSTGVCWFAAWGTADSINLVPQALAACTGWSDFTTEEALQVGERITNLMRLIYLRRGFTKDDELDVGEKMLDGLIEKPETAMRPHLPRMVDEYYEMMGWNVATGAPRPETVKRLGLEEFAVSVVL
jgi:aldehyde:ferredoxin oxidoreductase